MLRADVLDTNKHHFMNQWRGDKNNRQSLLPQLVTHKFTLLEHQSVFGVFGSGRDVKLALFTFEIFPSVFIKKIYQQKSCVHAFL